MCLGGNAIFNVPVYEAMYGKIETAEIRPVYEESNKAKIIPFKRKPNYLRKQNLLGKAFLGLGMISLLGGFWIEEMITLSVPFIGIGIAIINTKQNLLGEENERKK